MLERKMFEVDITFEFTNVDSTPAVLPDGKLIKELKVHTDKEDDETEKFKATPKVTDKYIVINVKYVQLLVRTMLEIDVTFEFINVDSSLATFGDLLDEKII